MLRKGLGRRFGKASPTRSCFVRFSLILGLDFKLTIQCKVSGWHHSLPKEKTLPERWRRLPTELAKASSSRPLDVSRMRPRASSFLVGLWPLTCLPNAWDLLHRR